jgi:hypothetical protein
MRKASGVTGAGRDGGFGFTGGSVATQVLITHGGLCRTSVAQDPAKFLAGGDVAALAATKPQRPRR